jgi:hypothetical protein
VKIEVEMLLRSYGITSCYWATRLTLDFDRGEPRVTYGRRRVSGYRPEDLALLYRRARVAGGRAEFDGINVQLAREVHADPSRAQLVDFGHYIVQEEFHRPVLSQVQGRIMRWGGAIWPESPDYVRPDPRLQVPFEHWGRPPEADAPGADVLALERSYAFAFDLARRFRMGECSADEVQRRMEHFAATALSRWR